MNEVSSVHINEASVDDKSYLDRQVLLESRQYMISRVKLGREWTYTIDRTKKKNPGELQEKKSVLHRYKDLWTEIHKNAKPKYWLNQADK